MTAAFSKLCRDLYSDALFCNRCKGLLTFGVANEEGLLLCRPIEPGLRNVGAKRCSPIALFDARLLPIAAVHGRREVFIIFPGSPRLRRIITKPSEFSYIFLICSDTIIGEIRAYPSRFRGYAEP